MPFYRQIFVIQDVARIHELFALNRRLVIESDRRRRSLGLQTVAAGRLAGLAQAERDFNYGLRQLAYRTSINATLRIEDMLRKTQKRADTGVSPHLRDRIACRALGQIAGFESGAVGIADEGILDQGGGFYWRTQEFGSGSSEVRSLIGNKLRGYFYGTGLRGTPAQPDPSQFRQHPVFAPGPPRSGQNLPFGIGEVRREIEGRHFIRDGALQAATRWRSELDALQATTIRDLSRIP